MFSDKLKRYYKPCGWLKFLLNIWWPFTILLTGSAVIERIAKWDSDNVSGFVWSLSSTVILLCANLLGHLLDKTSFVALLTALALREAFWIDSVVGLLISPKAETTSSGDMIVDSVVNAVFNALNGVIVMAAIISFIMLALTTVSVIYVVQRKDLFFEENW